MKPVRNPLRRKKMIGNLRLIWIPFIALISIFSACDSDTGTSPEKEVSSSSGFFTSSEVFRVSSMETLLSSSSLVLPSSSIAVIMPSSSASLVRTFTVSPSFGVVTQILEPGEWQIQYSPNCTNGTLVVAGAFEGSSCDMVVGNITITDVESMTFQGRPSSVTLKSQCALSCF